jgi:hypothetical protein
MAQGVKTEYMEEKRPSTKRYGRALWDMNLPERFDRSPISHTVRKARDMPSALPVL